MQQTATGNPSPKLSGLVLDGQGNAYLAGGFENGSIGFGATTLSTVTPRTPTTFPSSDGTDLFVAKLTATGTGEWAMQGDPNGRNMAGISGVATDGLGHLYIGGTYTWASARIGGILLPNQSSITSTPGAPLGQVSYGTDVFVARLNAATGAWDWTIRAGGTQGDIINAVTADAQGRVYVASSGFRTSGLDNPLPGGGRVQLAQLDGATGAWRWTLPKVAAVSAEQLAVDQTGRLIVAGFFTGPTATFGPVTVAQQGGSTSATGYLARLGMGPLGTRATAPGWENPLQVWPNPSAGRTVQVQGPAAGQAVQVLDALGRVVAGGVLPASGPLALALPPGLAAGLYVVRAAGQARQLVVE